MLNDSFDNVECCFDKVERSFDNVAGVGGALVRRLDQFTTRSASIVNFRTKYRIVECESVP